MGTRMRDMDAQLREANARLTAALESEQQLGQDLRAANEFRSLFLTAIAHDIRTPLTAVIGYTNLLSRDELDEKPRRKAIEQVAAAAERLRERVEELLAVAAIDFRGMSRSTFDLLPVIGRAVSGSEAKVQVDLTTGIPSVAGDASAAEHVIGNLLGTIGRLARGTPVTVTAQTQQDMVTITVSEERSTLSPEETETLFERFFGLPGSASAPESGVGLYVAKRLAEAQGGELLVIPRDPKGIAFLFTLPVADGFASGDGLR